MVSSQQTPIYFDQNILSGLQVGRAERQFLLDFLAELRNENCLCVYSDVNVQECRISNKPADFAEILDEMSASYLSNAHEVSSSILQLEGAKARSLLLQKTDLAEGAERLIDQLLIPIHFAMGWLSPLDEMTVKREMIEEVETFFDCARSNLPRKLHAHVHLGMETTIKAIEDLDWTKLSAESAQAYGKLRGNLPANLAQLDEIPAKEVIEVVLGAFEDSDRNAIVQTYPTDFWSIVEAREHGKLSSFAFMLSLTDLVRDPRMKKGKHERRLQHFLGQWRDCQHIEIASRCQAFLTFDKGAARLAKAIYAYAGVKTEVIHLVKA